MTIISIIIGWLFLMAFYLLWWKFRDDRIHGRSFFNFGDFNFLVAALTALAVVWGVLTLVAPEPSFQNADKQIEFGNKTRQPWLVTKALWSKIQQDSTNPDYNFALVENHFIQAHDPFTPPDLHEFQNEEMRIFRFYTDLSEKENNVAQNDIGYLFLAKWYLDKKENDPEAAEFCLRQVENKRLKYFNYINGMNLLYRAGPEAAEIYFQQELRVNGYKEGAWEGLATIYELSGRTDDLKKLVYNPESVNAIPAEYRSQVYFLNGDLISFYKLRFGRMFESLTVWGILGDLLILFTWLFFLWRLSFLSPVKWKHFFLAVGIGAVLAMFSWLLYEWYHHVLHFWTNGEIGNDLLFSFAGIGLIEEMVKLVPFLLLLRFTKIIKKPIDFLLIASAAGLGFAFFENLLYFSKYGFDVIHSRALTASVSHMASSAIVAYGFVLVKFRYPGKYWIIPVFFLAAVFAHGFYDFWLLNEKVHRLTIVTLFFFLSEILVYVSFLNNALNQSTDEISGTAKPILNTQRLAGFIAGALLLIFVLEYAGTCFVYGITIGNKTLLNAFFSGGYLIFFLSVRLSNIFISPGKWEKIEFFAGILPSEIATGKRTKRDSMIGRSLLFLPDPLSGNNAAPFPLNGKINRRLTIQGFSGWFEIEFESPATFGILQTSTIYIRPKNPGDKINEDEIILVEIFVRKENELQMHFVDFAGVKEVDGERAPASL